MAYDNDPITNNLMEAVRGVRYGKPEELHEASPVNQKELSPETQKKIPIIEKAFGVKFKYANSGATGDVLEFDGRNMRITGDNLTKISKLKLRWIEFGNNFISIGV